VPFGRSYRKHTSSPQCLRMQSKVSYKGMRTTTTAPGRNVYDRVSHLETAHGAWLKLFNTYESSSEIKSSHKDTYNRQYQTFSQKHG
jgi:hypothetical protein